MNKNTIEIIENAPITVIIGLYYQHNGIIDVDSLYVGLNTYRNLPLKAKANSKLLKKLIQDVNEIISFYENMSFQEIKTNVFLIRNDVLKIDRSLQYPIAVISDKDDNLVKVLNEKTNLYFQKNALSFLKRTGTTRVVTIVNENEIYISLTEKKIAGVSYKLSNGISTNFNKKYIGMIEPGFYKIDHTPIEGEDKKIYYKLIYVKKRKII